jgi:hypothetical protein
MKSKIQAFLFFTLFTANSGAEMSRINDTELSEVTGQSGVYLSGEVSINTQGGPTSNSYFGECTDVTKSCGARLTFQTQQNGGWFVLDDIKGSIAFEGLTFQVREITSGFGGDGALFNQSVMEIGMPESVRMNDFEFTLATGSSGRPDDATYRQVDLMTVEMSGELTLEGNLLVFPTP